MRASFFLLILIVVSSRLSTYAQDMSIHGMEGKLGFNTIPQELVDQAQYRVVYNYSFVKDPENPQNRTEAITLLQIGKNHNRFLDFYQIPLDSFVNAKARSKKQESDGIAEFMLRREAVKFDFDILIDRDKNETTTTMPTTFNKVGRYTEPTPELQWNILEGDTIIAGYACKKATTQFAGREYVAWFAPEVRLPFGPYKFSKLPGLIFRISDTQNHHIFQLTGLEQVNQPDPIYIDTEKSIIKSTRSKTLQAARNYHKNPSMVFENSGVIILEKDGSPLKVRSLPYNPIELE